MAYKAVRKLLLGKDVVVVPMAITPDDQIVVMRPDWIECKFLVECLEPCRMLRCRSIKFESKLRLKRLIEEIVSEKPVGLFLEWPRFMKLINSLQRRNAIHMHSEFVREHGPALDVLKSAVVWMDVVNAKVYTSRLLSHIMQWNKDTAEHKADNAKERFEYAHEKARIQEQREWHPWTPGCNYDVAGVTELYELEMGKIREHEDEVKRQAEGFPAEL